jgi:hypothetical protein
VFLIFVCSAKAEGIVALEVLVVSVPDIRNTNFQMVFGRIIPSMVSIISKELRWALN